MTSTYGSCQVQIVTRNLGGLSKGLPHARCYDPDPAQHTFSCVHRYSLLPRYQPRQNRHGIGGADQTAHFPLDHDIDIDIVIFCL